jgi:hypothetical protein
LLSSVQLALFSGCIYVFIEPAHLAFKEFYMTKLENIVAHLEDAHELEKENHIAGAQDGYRCAITESLSSGVTEYSTREEACKFFEQNRLVELLEKVVELNKFLLVEVAAGRYSTTIIGGTYELILFVQFCWLLRRHELSNVFLEFAALEGIQKTQTKFWAEFYRAICSLIKNEAYEPVNLSLKGLERYWVTYLFVISDITNKRDPGVSINEMKRSFEKRNRDKRLKDDIYEIEGTAWCPAKWDFRGESILLYASEQYGVKLSQ